MKSTQPANPTHDAIAVRAFQIWMQEGKPTGKNVQHWLQAEAELRNGGNAKAKAAAGSPSVTPSPRVSASIAA